MGNIVAMHCDCTASALMLGGIGLVFVASGAPSVLFSIFAAAVSDCTLKLRFLSIFADWNVEESYADKVVLVTGASSGIGAACAREYSKRGATVVLAARRLHELDLVRQSCKNPDRHVVVQLDLLDTGTHKSVVDDIFDKVGKVDLLVNNAGRSQRSLVECTELDVFNRMLQLNTIGTISITKQVYARMKPGSQIAVVTSLAGKLGSPGAAAYSVTKFALHGFFETLRVEAAVNSVGINIICPGPVVSNGGEMAMTGSGAVAKDDPDTPASSYDKRRMKTTRCARLMAVATRQNLPEVWISPNPELMITYIAQYAPGLYQRMALILGPKRIKKFKRQAKAQTK